MAISVTIKGLDGVVVELGKFGPELARRVVLDMSQVAFERMQEGASRHSKQGNLFASVFNRPITGGREVGHDLQRAPHAMFILFGTKDHFVAPKDKKALRWAGDGKFFFSKGHRVKGILSDNYLEVAATDAIKAMPGIVDKALKEQ
jgi:hypothetical protein